MQQNRIETLHHDGNPLEYYYYYYLLLFVYVVLQHDRLRTDTSALRISQHLAELGDHDKVFHQNAEVFFARSFVAVYGHVLSWDLG